MEFNEFLRNSFGDKSLGYIQAITGVSKSHISKILRGERSIPKPEILKKLSKVTNCTYEELMSAAGYYTEEQKPKSIRIPVLGIIHAGLPIEAVENIIDYEEISLEMSKKGEYFALKVNGDSMLPTFLNNDIVIIKKQATAENGSVCVVLVNGDDATLKRIKKDENGILLIPDNPAYDTLQFSNKEITDKPVKILGKVVELRRSF